MSSRLGPASHVEGSAWRRCTACAAEGRGCRQNAPTFGEEVPQSADRLVQQGPQQRDVQARCSLELRKRDVCPSRHRAPRTVRSTSSLDVRECGRLHCKRGRGQHMAHIWRAKCNSPVPSRSKLYWRRMRRPRGSICTWMLPGGTYPWRSLQRWQ